MQEGYREKEHLLSLKVMRLTKPSVKPLLHVTNEPQDLPGDIFNNSIFNDVATTKGAEMLNCGELLSLPQAFGSIYLGETFSCYVSILNDSNQVTKDVTLKTDIQTSSQRFQLTASTPRDLLSPDESQDEVLSYEVKELGTHILICAVSYTSPNGEKLFMRRFYKFQVLKPLEVKTKFYNGEFDSVFLEAQVQNITTNPISMDHVTLDPSQYYMVLPLNELTPVGGEVFDSTYINPMDMRQYLYKLIPKECYKLELRAMPMSPIGKLDIVWRTNFGEIGRLQTSQLQRTAPTDVDIKLVVEESPDTIAVEQQFEIACKLKNFGSSKMEAKLFLTSSSSSLLWCGISGKVLGPLPPNSSLEFKLHGIATRPGLHSIGGVRILDMNSTKMHDFDDICQLLVYTNEQSPFL